MQRTITQLRDAQLWPKRASLLRRSKTIVVRNFTSVAAKLIFETLDFVYVDARHDYCGALEDISLYWPKVR
jgi:hypothetical protein